MPVRMICWNIEKFGPAVMNKANVRNAILETVHPNAGARLCDLFIIIEPRNNQGVAAGDIAQGNGADCIFRFLGNLQGRANNGAGWRAVTPLSLVNDTTTETIAVFYHTAVLGFRGPNTRTQANHEDPWDMVSARTGAARWIDTTFAPPVLRMQSLDGTNSSNVTIGAAPADIYVDVPGNRVYWRETGTGAIWRCDLNGANNAARVPAANATSLQVDAAGAHMYWTNAAGEIWSSDLDGNGAAGIVNVGNANTPANLTLDRAAHRLYWTDAAQEIRSADAAGAGAAAIVPAVDANTPSRLAVSPGNDKIYWVDGTGAIRWAGRGGATPAEIVAAGDADGPESLVTDAAHLYWIARGANEIDRADLNGSNPTTWVTHAQAGTPVSLTIEAGQDRMSWIDTAAGGKIKAARLSDGEDVQTMAAGTGENLQVATGDAWDGRADFGALFFPNNAERNPFLVRFNEIGVGEFYVVAAHSPSPDEGQSGVPVAQYNRLAQLGTAALGTIPEVAAAPGAGTRIVIVGDFNVCSVLTPDPNCTQGRHPSDRAIISTFNTGPLGMNLRLWQSQSSLKDSLVSPSTYKNHAYDHILERNFTGVANSQVIDPVQAAWLLLANPNNYQSKNAAFKRVAANISDHLAVKADFTW